jgi:chromate reductase, NAD(P)H dehydrogenase (quinone)
MDSTIMPPIETPPAGRVLVIPASTRSVSLNRALGQLITQRLAAAGDRATLIDLAAFPMPMYDGDIEHRDGVPDSATQLLSLIDSAEVLILVSPEYNGSFPPLLKNTIDWMSRTRRGILDGVTVMIASASPGGRGGRRGIGMLRDWMNHMHAQVPELTLSAGSVSLDDEGLITGVDEDALAEFVAHALDATRTT